MDKKAAIYTRVASPDGADRLAEQEAACRRYCEEHGWDAIVFDDRAISGADMDRPQLNALRAAVAAGEIGAVVVTDVTRLSRQVPDCLRLCEELQRAGVELHTV